MLAISSFALAMQITITPMVSQFSLFIMLALSTSPDQTTENTLVLFHTSLVLRTIYFQNHTHFLLKTSDFLVLFRTSLVCNTTFSQNSTHFLLKPRNFLVLFRTSLVCNTTIFQNRTQSAILPIPPSNRKATGNGIPSPVASPASFLIMGGCVTPQRCILVLP